MFKFVLPTCFSSANQTVQYTVIHDGHTQCACQDVEEIVISGQHYEQHEENLEHKNTILVKIGGRKQLPKNKLINGFINT